MTSLREERLTAPLHCVDNVAPLFAFDCGNGAEAPCKHEQLAEWLLHSCDTAISSQIIPALRCLYGHTGKDWIRDTSESSEA